MKYKFSKSKKEERDLFIYSLCFISTKKNYDGL